MTPQEKEETKLTFYEKADFPGVIGCIDGTHIRIITPHKVPYYGRKGFHSINAMLVCDHMMRIRFVDAKYPESCNDFVVWTQSALRHQLQQRYDDGERNCWLLGDSGYPLQPFLITPFRSTSEGSIEASFNNMHSKIRNIIERTIGVLKNRFRCILEARELHYTPAKATKIINASCSLQNICIHFIVQENSEDVGVDQDLTDQNESAHDVENSVSIRNNITHSIIY